MTNNGTRTVRAHAKVNLGLDVLQEKDGYHLLDMIMAPTDLFDEIRITPSDHDRIISSTPLPSGNTLEKALEILRENGLKGHYQIELDKRIPSQAGLGGGSADGAALLRALIETENLSIPPKKLEEMAFSIGADTVFCLFNTPARVSGFGETVIPIDWKGSFPVLLVRPDFGISTPLAFQTWDRLQPRHGDMDALQRSLETGNPDFEQMSNSLEPAAFLLEPRLETVRDEIRSLGPEQVVMSGSGSTLIVLDHDEAKLDRIRESLEKRFSFVKKTTVGKPVDAEKG